MVGYEVVDGKLRIDCSKWAIAPSIEDSSAAMAVIIDRLMEVKDVAGIVLVERREIEYDYEQTKMLREIAEAFNDLLNVEKVLDINKLGCSKHAQKRFGEIRFLLTEVLRKDPLGAYVRASQLIRYAQKDVAKIPDDTECFNTYIEKVLLPIKLRLEKTTMIKKVKGKLGFFLFGDRSLYRELFTPLLKPSFMLTRFSLNVPKNAVLIDKYKISGATVEIYKLPDRVKYTYYLTPEELNLSEEEYKLLETARQYMATHKPTEAEMVDPQKIRQVFFNIAKDLLRDLSSRSEIRLTLEKTQIIANAIVRYTAGYGALELLLADDKIQDIYINAPPGSSPAYIYHSDFGECETNILPTKEEAESWATRFRLYSGRPLDEASPVLDTEIIVPGGRARVAAITKSLSPEGLAFAFRRHREKAWTFPLFIRSKMLDPIYAGLMSFIADGGRSVLIAGGRGAGKTSLLSALMLEIMRKFRILVQQDTLELPVEQLRQLGYNIESLKSRSVITHIETELSPDEALRTALRLGDSVLIVGEVRSVESTVLFEAMRIGALANMVAGTIHGESAYGVFDRVVHDLGLAPTSFKALDVLTICNMLKSPDGLHRFRRVTEVTEVRKKWKEDPMEEGGFVTLMEYSAKDDRLKPTDTLLNGESEVLNEIAKRVREWHGAWDLVWENILLRGKIKKTIVDYADHLNKPELLEAEWVVPVNEMFHAVSESVIAEVGSADAKIVYEKWLGWFKKALK